MLLVRCTISQQQILPGQFRQSEILGYIVAVLTGTWRTNRPVSSALTNTQQYQQGMLSEYATRWPIPISIGTYTEWLHFDGQALHGDFTRPVARELYSHKTDPGNDPDLSENKNIVGAADAALLDKLHGMLEAGFKQPTE